MDFDFVCKVWPARAAMLKTIEMQERRAPNRTDWHPVVRDCPHCMSHPHREWCGLAKPATPTQEEICV